MQPTPKRIAGSAGGRGRAGVVAALALTTASCASNVVSETTAIEVLRARAAESDASPRAIRELAIGEMLLPGGQPDRAGQALNRVLAKRGADVALWFLAGQYEDNRGRPRLALARYLRALQQAPDTPGSEAALASEATLAALGTLEHLAPAWREKVEATLTRTFQTKEDVPPSVWHAAMRLRLELAVRRGDAQGAQQAAAQAGCLQRYRVAGPFGPPGLLSFDRPMKTLVQNGRLKARYDLGPRRGVRPTREVVSRHCTLHLGTGPVAASGTTIVEGAYEAPTSGPYVARLETPNPAELFVDGRRVARLDRRREPLPRVVYVPLVLEAGTRTLRVRVTTRHPNPVLSLAVVPGELSIDAARTTTGESPLLQSFLRAYLDIARGDPVGARERLRVSAAKRHAPTAVLLLAAQAALADPLRPQDLVRDDVRGLLKRAARRDPKAWRPRFQSLQLDVAEGRTLRVIERLRRARRRWPQIVAFPLLLAEIYRSRGWRAHAEQAARHARAINPDSCRAIDLAFFSAQRREQFQKSRNLAGAVVRCDARSRALYRNYLRAREWAQAESELQRLKTLEPTDDATWTLLERLRLARARDDGAAVARILARLRVRQPRNPAVRLSEADERASLGQGKQARVELARAIENEPASLAQLRWAHHVLGGPDPLAAYRRRGEEVIARFEQSDRQYNQPQALVFDYTVVRVFEDGSTAELTHNIWRVQSQASADERGEFSLPEGARLLQLHTIKPDGRRLEADFIEGKDTISLPQVGVGDYVEYEYLRFGEPSGSFPEGYLGDRFYFQSFETPFDWSEYVLVLPGGWTPVVDARGEAPIPQETRDSEVRVLRWAAKESQPLRPEPQASSSKEWVPSVNVGVNATWEAYVRSLHELLADKNVRDPEAVRTLAQAASREDSRDPASRLQRLYAWVLDHIDHEDDFFGSAPAMLARRAGHRTRVLHYLLLLAGIPSKLVIARGVASDRSDTPLPDLDTFQHVLLRVGEPTAYRFLWMDSRWAPFGYVPPALRGELALVLDDTGTTRTTVLGPDVDRHDVEIDVYLRAGQATELNVREMFTGLAAVRWRTSLESTPEAELKQRFEEAHVSRVVEGGRLKTLEIERRLDRDSPLVFRYQIEAGGFGRRQGLRWALPLLFKNDLTANYAPLAGRSTTQVVVPPVHRKVVQRFHSAGGQVGAAPLRSFTGGGPRGARFELRSGRREKTLVVTRTTRLPVQRVAPKQYPNLVRFCQGVDETEAQEVTVVLSER